MTCHLEYIFKERGWYIRAWQKYIGPPFLISTWILSAYSDEVEPHILFVKPYLFSLPIPNPSLSNFIDYCSCYLWFGELCFDQTKATAIPLSLVIVLINQIDFLLLPYWYLMEFRWFLGNCVCALEGLSKPFHCIFIVVFWAQKGV